MTTQTTQTTSLRIDPAYLAWNTVASYDDQGAAQAAVAQLADAGFPIEHLDLVGSDLRSVERITGRLSRARIAATGAIGGLWTGLFVGLVFSFFVSGPAVASALVAGLLIGAATGAGFALAGRSPVLGARNFASVRSIVAARYDLVARNGFVEQARALLRDGGSYART